MKPRATTPKTTTPMTFRKAMSLGYIGKDGFAKCPYCGSKNLSPKPQTDGQVTCDGCGCVQGYISYGYIDPIYVKEE